jgi:hypothetical protein
MVGSGILEWKLKLKKIAEIAGLIIRKLNRSGKLVRTGCKFPPSLRGE